MNDLQPAEHLALTVARSQLSREINPEINVTTVLVLTIDRLTAEVERLRPLVCTGAYDCPAPAHILGCYAGYVRVHTDPRGRTA